jgi:hypothetical protein
VSPQLVDLGFHYVAVNPSGKPIDSDADGLPDALEDRNGNDTQDSGETLYGDPDTDNDDIWDGSELALGLDPFVNQAANSELRRNYIYDLNNRLKDVTGKGKVSFQYDKEGNITTVTP